MLQGVLNAVGNWNTSGANVSFVANQNGNSGVPIYVHMASLDAGTWGFTSESNVQIGGHWYVSHMDVSLNSVHSGDSTSIWTSTAAHELGHALGLDHNNFNNGSSYMVMNSCGSCGSSAQRPQNVDITIINRMYPFYVQPRLLVPDLAIAATRPLPRPLACHKGVKRSCPIWNQAATTGTRANPELKPTQSS